MAKKKGARKAGRRARTTGTPRRPTRLNLKPVTKLIASKINQLERIEPRQPAAENALKVLREALRMIASTCPDPNPKLSMVIQF